MTGHLERILDPHLAIALQKSARALPTGTLEESGTRRLSGRNRLLESLWDAPIARQRILMPGWGWFLDLASSDSIALSKG